MSGVKNRAGTTFMRAMKKVDQVHKKIDRRARDGKYNEDCAPKFKFTKKGARVWTF